MVSFRNSVTEVTVCIPIQNMKTHMDTILHFCCSVTLIRVKKFAQTARNFTWNEEKSPSFLQASTTLPETAPEFVVVLTGMWEADRTVIPKCSQIL